MDVYIYTVIVKFCVWSAERMNRMVVYLILVFVVGSVGVMARQILFNLAGERFVARLRKQVMLMLFYM